MPRGTKSSADSQPPIVPLSYFEWHFEMATIEAHAAGKAEGCNIAGYVLLSACLLIEGLSYRRAKRAKRAKG